MALNIVNHIDDLVSIRHVLASVSDKKGLEIFIPGLVKINPAITIFSTGGTYSALQTILGPKAALNLKQVSDYTGQPEMQGGLVKTLDFKIYLGLLSETYNVAHKQDLERSGAVEIDMVIVNLYPFQQTIAKPGVSAEMARTNVDIGGPCMVRASAKNFLRVASITDPASYDAILGELNRQHGKISLATRFALAHKAFAHTAAYDTAIAGYLGAQTIDSIKACYTVAK